MQSVKVYIKFVRYLIFLGLVSFTRQTIYHLVFSLDLKKMIFNTKLNNKNKIENCFKL